VEELEQWIGRSASRQFAISEELITAFADLTGDRSPIHVDDQYARRRGLRSRVAHGALQGGLVSCVVGMDLPGERGLLQELSLKFRQPCYVGDVLTVTLTVQEAYESVRTIRLGVRIVNQDDKVVATGTAQSGIAPS